MSDRYPGGFLTNATPTVSTSSATGVWTLEQQLGYQANGDWPLPPAGAVQISRSLRFNFADSTYLSRTPAGAGNRKTWTMSFWVKRTILGASFDPLISNLDSGAQNGLYFFFGSAGELKIGDYPTGAYTWVLETSQFFRDVSAWYHITIAFDTTQATSSDRVKIFVNGTQVTAFSTATYPSQNSDGLFNTSSLIGIGSLGQYAGAYLAGYMAYIDIIDGQALDASYFGQTNATTGVWEPIQTVGYLTYGTNGFHLDFADNSTTTTLGYDTSGNSNNFTPNNFSVTAGTGNDSLVDTPTHYGTDTGAGGEVRGNYCTLNSTLPGVSSYISNGNLQFVNTYQFLGTMRLPTSGKWYAECTMTTVGGTSGGIIIGLATVYNSGASKLGIRAGANTTYNDFSATVDSSTHSALANNDVVGLAYDADNGTFDVYINNTIAAEFSSVPSTLNGSQYTFACFGDYTTDAGFWNFGQRPFAYTAPSGFKALCTTNLPEPDVVQGNTAFNTVLWTGDNSYPRSITGVGFQPDFVWAKARSIGYYNYLFDAVRGAGSAKELSSNDTSAEGTYYEYVNLSSFDTDGFTAGSTTEANGLNANSQTFVAWNWKGGGSGVSNTDGSITSTVSANPTAGISIVTYTGTGSIATIGHGIGVAPTFIVTKKRSNTSNWATNAPGRTNPWDGALLLNSTNAFTVSNTVWNDTAPTSSVFTVGTADAVNISGETYVAYCFAAVEGFSAMGSYTGNGSTDGPFVYTGFRPAFLMTKIYSGSTDHWNIFDNKRTTYNVINKNLKPNLSNAEATDASILVDFTSNGFKLRQTDGQINGSGYGYIYMAFAENPFKYALAR